MSLSPTKATIHGIINEYRVDANFQVEVWSKQSQQLIARINSLLDAFRTSSLVQKNPELTHLAHRNFQGPGQFVETLLQRGINIHYAQGNRLSFHQGLQGGGLGSSRASSSTSAEDQYQMGLNFHFGKNGKTTDFVEAVKYYRLAADQEHAWAQNNLGVCYEYGMGVTKDLVEAVKYYRLAADQRHAGAQNSLGFCYYKGEGVTKDLAEAVKYYRLAVDQKHAMAQNNLGFCYYKGEGVVEDLVEAVKYYRLAADQGDAKAQRSLEQIYSKHPHLKLAATASSSARSPSNPKRSSTRSP
ncbi:MAG: Secretory immunoglobulin A-binding protein EsiB, partial [Chlamydiae bacterium]|nr:Secretory immunoglobulin A-binding protein EsiB [Chlamydiota bacterium]